MRSLVRAIISCLLPSTRCATCSIRCWSVIQASARTLVKAFGPDVVRRPGYRDALVETAVVVNAALAAHSIAQEIEA